MASMTKCLRVAESTALQIEAGQNIERIQQRDAARRGRRGRHDARAMVFADQRLALDDSVVREIRERPDAAVRPHPGHQIGRDPALRRIPWLPESAMASRVSRQVRLLDESADLRHIRRRRSRNALAASGERSSISRL